MMEAKKEVKAGAGYTIGNILIKGIVFITLPIFSRILSTEQFGIYNTYMAYESIIAIFLGMGVYSSIKNAKFDYPDKIDKYVSTVLWMTVIPLIVCSVISIVLKEKISAQLGLPSVFIVLLVLQSYGSAMLSISNSRLSLNYKYKSYIAYAAFNTVVNIALSIFLIVVVFDEHKEYGRIIGSAVPLIILGAYIFLTNQKKGEFKFDYNMSKYAATIGFPLIAHYLSQQIQNQFDRIAITNLVGTSETGIYSFAYNIAVVLQVIFYSLENVWGVWMFSHMESREYHAIREASKKYMWLIAFIAIMMLVFSKEVIFIMGDKEYWSGATIFVPILIAMFLLYLYTIPVSIEYYFKQTKYIAMMTVVAAVFNIVTNYMFIPIFGYAAAAYTTLASYGILFVLHWIISIKILRKNNITSVYSLKEIAKAFMTVSLVGVVVLLLNQHPIIKYCFFVALFAIIGAIYKNKIGEAVGFIYYGLFKKAKQNNKEKMKMQIDKDGFSEEDLRRLHSILLEILDYFDSVCRTNGLQYCITGGTALGAMRHKGFIPWDDDIDVALPRDDYERFVSIMAKTENNMFKLQDENSESNYFLPFVKIRKQGTVFVEESSECVYKDNGVFIDVFPLDYADRVDTIGFAFNYNVIKILKHILRFRGCKAYYKNHETKIKYMFDCLLEAITRKWSNKEILSLIKNRMISRNDSDKNYLVSYAGIYSRDKEIWPVEIMLPPKEIIFENKLFYTCADADAYLTKSYGDYMRLPSAENRHTHKPAKFDF